MIDAGVAIGLGTDGVSSNDTARIFDVMGVAGLFHSVSGPDHTQWIRADEILTMATIGGARSAMLENVTGSLEIGKVADLLIIDLTTLSFTPLNDIAKHLVYSENGSSIETVMVAGEIVLDRGVMRKIDEAAIWLKSASLFQPIWLNMRSLSNVAPRFIRPWPKSTAAPQQKTLV